MGQAAVIPILSLFFRRLRDDIPRASFDLLVDPGQIEPDDAQADHDNTAREGLQQDDRRKAAQGHAGDLLIEGDDREHQGHREHQHPDM